MSHSITVQVLDDEQQVVAKHVEQLTKEGAYAVSNVVNAVLDYVKAPNPMSTELANKVARLSGKARKIVLELGKKVDSKAK